MKVCPIDGEKFDPTKDFFVTINERKATSVDVCSIACAILYTEED